MANISHFTQTVNGVSTTYDIHDANAVNLNSNQTVGGIKTFSNAPVVNSISLDGKSIDTDVNNNMTFNGNIVDTIEEQGDGYIRYTSGLQICWGSFAGISATTSKTITFQKPFATWGDVTVTLAGQNGSIVTEISGWGVTEFFVRASADLSNNLFMWQAIGRWK